MIGVKTTVITSAVSLFNLKKKKKKHEQMEDLVIFLPVRLAMYFSYLGGITGWRNVGIG